MLCTSYDRYHSIREKFVIKFQEKKTAYLSSCAESYSSNPQKFWRTINFNSNKYKTNSHASPSPDEFATYFEQFIGKNISTTSNALNTLLPPKPINPQMDDTTNLLTITMTETEQLIMASNLKSSFSPDGISGKFISHAIKPMCKILCLLFNLTLRSGFFPTQWNTSHIFPLHKGGSRENVENYRPISLQPTLCKIFERFIYQKLLNSMISKISNNQHFSIPHRSTDSNKC